MKLSDICVQMPSTVFCVKNIFETREQLEFAQIMNVILRIFEATV